MHRAFRSQNEAAVSIPHRDNLIHSEDVYNIFRKLHHLESKNYNVYVDNDYNSSFIFGFCSSWQASLLTETKDFSLDATHNTTAFKGSLLYTLVIRHAETGTGCPAAYLFTTYRSFLPVSHWLYHLKHSASLCPEKITIDMSDVEENAIRSIFLSVNIQWCLFHVLRAISQQVRAKLVLESLSDRKRAHQAVISQLKGMMWENSRAEYTRKLSQFIQEFNIYSAFMLYFKNNYLDNDRFTKWTAAYQPDRYTNMETINYVESWHNQLKTSYLQRRNRRVDRLVYILVNDVEEDFLSNINRIRMNVERMGPEAREAKRRKLEAEEVSIHVAMDMISEVERVSLCNVQSFNNADETYEIRVENAPTYTEVSSIEGLQPEPEHKLQREQEDMVQKLEMLKEVVENLRPNEVTSSWKLQVEQPYKEVVLRSNQVEELPSNIHLERHKIFCGV
ncbi:hypothetical protein RMATCC62417_18250 [Rhizopus microsporus]|nr:hypothetical protein RMATCC62417_18250 [Rhizopus microsporus]